MINIPQESSQLSSVERLALRPLRAADAAVNRLYGWKYNPLHQTGTIAAALLGVLIITGLYLLIFYRVGSPYESVQRLQENLFFGRWVRSLHRFATDAMIVAVVVHAWRMFAQSRSWGPRALAWSSGISLLVLTLISGWTGYVMVWDSFGHELAVNGARFFDALPVLSEPTRRIFAGDQNIPEAFFFLNLFLHVALPLGAAAGLWVHVWKVARPTLLPPRPLLYTIVGALFVLAVFYPTPLAPKASLFSVPDKVPADIFFAFWFPWANALSPWMAWAGAAVTFAIIFFVPLFVRRERTEQWVPSWVDERYCTGCNQCPQDCPWEAITMIPRTNRTSELQSELVANVNPALCVSCGICSASCPPMGVGPAGRTGRDQVVEIRNSYRGVDPKTVRPVAFMCEYAAPAHKQALEERGAEVRPVPCAGNLHTSAIELTLRAGAPGVMVYTCAPRDCRGREGPKWLHERMYNDREAELQARVDRNRVRTAVMTPGNLQETLREWDEFDSHLNRDKAGESVDDPIDLICVPVPIEEEE